MVDILFCMDLYNLTGGDEAQPKEMSLVIHHLSYETNVCALLKKLEAKYEKKNAVNKIFLVKMLVNIKFKEGGPIEDHINEFQSVMNQLATIKMIFENEMQTLLLLSFLSDIWEILVVIMSSSTLDGVLSTSQVSNSLLNE